LELEQKYNKIENSLEQKDDVLCSVQEELEVGAPSFFIRIFLGMI